MAYLIRIFTVLLIMGMSGCAILQPDADKPENPILAVWSLITGATGRNTAQPVIVARFVIRGTGQACSEYRLRSATHVLTPGTRTNPDPGKFPVTLCQANLPGTAVGLTLFKGDNAVQLRQANGARSDITFSGFSAIGRKHPDELVLVTLGDTGCRGDDLQPDCRLNGTDWPLLKLSTIAATRINPDLVIHLGDYRYFHAGLSEDNWMFWFQDFFSAAQPLLLAAPWAFSRGNHEQCHRSGQSVWYGTGWLYLFEPTTSFRTTACPAKPEPVLLKPWYFDIAAPGIKAHRFIMIDTATNLPKKDLARRERLLDMSANFDIAIDLANQSSSAWWLSHRPVLSLSHGHHKWRRSSHNVRQALRLSLNNRPALCNPVCSPNTMLSGHIHHHQKIELFAADKLAGPPVWPQLITVGNGGTKLSRPFKTAPCIYKHFPKDIAATGIVESHSDHGFVTWRRSAKTLDLPSGWQREPYYIHGPRPAETSPPVSCKLVR